MKARRGDPVNRLLTASILVVACTVLSASPSRDQQAASSNTPRYRTLDDKLIARPPASLAEWQRRATYLREHILASAGLLPMPEKPPLRAHVFGERRHGDYSVHKVYFESLPGFYVTGNLYRPTGAGPFPAILSPHGHWPYGRLENTPVASVPGRAINLAQQGFVVFSYDMIGYNDSSRLTHTFGGKREALWGLSLAGLQLWNSIRSVDFLESLPEVDRNRIGATGASGGGTQTFLLAAVDERIKVAAPVNMISLHFQGGCLCENLPGLRLGTNNVELAAAIAPRPLLMVSATGDWTKDTMQVEYPAMRAFYALFDAESRVHAVQFDAPHNYNRDSREAMYAWMARWLKHAPADGRVAERNFRPDPLPDLLVFHGRPLPEDAATPEQLTDRWIASAKRQAEQADPRLLQSALLHALAVERQAPKGELQANRQSTRTVVLASDDDAVRAALLQEGFSVRPVRAPLYDRHEADQIAHFDTYNRTSASQRVADIVAALHENAGAALVADGDFGLPAVLALAAAPADRVVIDVGQVDNTNDDAFLAGCYIPGIRRAGDLQTAVSMTTGTVMIHNAADRFRLDGVRIEPRKLSAAQIVRVLKNGRR